MKTCTTCIYWQRVGTANTPRRIVHDHRVQIVPPGEEGTCRACPPFADNRWPLTMAGDWCGQHAQPRSAEGGTRSAKSADADALARLDAELEARRDELARAATEHVLRAKKNLLAPAAGPAADTGQSADDTGANASSLPAGKPRRA